MCGGIHPFHLPSLHPLSLRSSKEHLQSLHPHPQSLNEGGNPVCEASGKPRQMQVRAHINAHLPTSYICHDHSCLRRAILHFKIFLQVSEFLWHENVRLLCDVILSRPYLNSQCNDTNLHPLTITVYPNSSHLQKTNTANRSLTGYLHTILRQNTTASHRIISTIQNIKGQQMNTQDNSQDKIRFFGQPHLVNTC